MTVARSSICDVEPRHCAGAAMHAQLGTSRDIAPMAIGTAAHHLVFAVTMRAEGELADKVIDGTAIDLVANGRSFDGGPVEHLRMTDVDRARDLALNFLDRDVIPERGDGWMEAEVLVAVDRHFTRVDRDVCECKHFKAVHHSTGECCASVPGHEHCACDEFRPVAIWQQAADLICIYQDEIDDEEVTVVEGTDYKPVANESWFTGLQGKGYAVTGKAVCPNADIIRRRVIGYMPWGGMRTNDLDLRQQGDADTLEDYQRAIEVAAEGHRRRQGRTPDELAQPGAGCSGGFGGCPFLLVCKPFAEQWDAVMKAGGVGTLLMGDATAAASVLVLAKAVQQEATKRVKVALESTDEVVTVDGKSVVGWKEFKGTKIAPNAAMLLAEQWVLAMLKLERGSSEAQLEQGRFEAMLLNALPKKGGATLVKGLVKRLKDVIGYEDAAALEALCLEDDPGRQLKAWKKTPPVADLLDTLKESVAAEPAEPSAAAADRKKAHDEKMDDLLEAKLRKSIGKNEEPGR